MNQRLDKKTALELLKSNPITLGKRADELRQARHALNAYYTINAAITYSNTCEALCPICSFSRKEGQEGAYILTADEVFERAKHFSQAGAVEIHIIGGIYSKLQLDYYKDIVRAVKNADKNLNIVAFTVSEYALMSKVSGKPLQEIFEIFKDLGVNAIPGGGAEIFNAPVRKKITPNKLTGEQWLDAMRTAHKCGFKTNATMLYGHIESPEDVVDHLFALRDLQDETGGFKAFVPLPFRRGKSEIPSSTSAVYDLKICSIARLILDNFDHIRVPVTHFDERLVQVLLCFGADDIGGSHWHEEVAVSAGAKPSDRDAKKLEFIIKSAGFNPVFTNSNYAR